jgi:hypothetical protein
MRRSTPSHFLTARTVLLPMLVAACAAAPGHSVRERFDAVRLGDRAVDVEAHLGAPVAQSVQKPPPATAPIDVWYLPPPKLDPIESPWGPGTVVITYDADGTVVAKKLNPQWREP